MQAVVDAVAAAAVAVALAPALEVAEEEVMETEEEMADEATRRAIGVGSALADTDDLLRTDPDGIDLAPTGKTGEVVLDAGSFVTYAKGAAPTSLGDEWSGVTYEATASGNKLSVTAYRNIEDSVRKPFSGEYNVDDNGVVTFVADALAGVGSKLDKTQFPQPEGPGGADVKWDYADDAATNDETERPLNFRGTLQGALGMYECTTEAGCTVTVAANGAYNATGEWTFTPADKAMALVEDDDYLYFGWWVSEPLKANKASDFTYDVRVFADGATEYTNTVALADD